MSKNPSISNEAQLLLNLLRIALGTETDLSHPQDIDWKEVIRLSYVHKVSALAADGLKQSGFDIYAGRYYEKVEEIKASLKPWFNDVERTEQSYAYYVNVLNALCQIYQDNGLLPAILKGYGLSLHYPIPSHRGAGDIDLMLINKEGVVSYEEGNRIIKDNFGLHITEDGEKGHHSSFSFKGITVENHFRFIGKGRYNTNYRILDKTLIDLLPKDITNGNGIYYPSTTFHAIFLIYHLHLHQSRGNPTLRQLTDYFCLIVNCGKDIDWMLFDDVLTKNGLMHYAEGIIGCLVTYFGLNDKLLSPNIKISTRQGQYLFKDIFSFDATTCHGARALRHYYKHREHYRYFYNVGWVKAFIFHIRYYIEKH